MSKYNRIVTNPVEFRKNVCDKLNNILNDENKSLNAEKGIYNYSIDTCEKKYCKKMEQFIFCVNLYTKIKMCFI